MVRRLNFLLSQFFIERVVVIVEQKAKPQHRRNSLRCAVGAMAFGIGVTAISCLIAAEIFHLPQNEAKAMEASAFNQNAASFHREALPAAAVSDGGPKTVVPLGSAFGIKLFTDGVIVASLSEVYTPDGLCCPARDAGIKPGDYLLSADGQEIRNNADLANRIGRSGGETMALKVRRGESELTVRLTPVYGDGAYRTGMWIRDSAAGIGTLTFYDPKSGCFAGLGHGICDMDVGGVMSLKTGEPAPITLCGIEKGTPQEPGQLQGYFSSQDALGTLLDNNETGVSGTLSSVPEGNAVEVLPKDEVKKGPVQILVTLDQSGPKLYDAYLERISGSSQQTKNLVVKITDQRLIAQTGGIVQGMSGSPILQDGKLAGAVTHVFTDDPTMGYGIFAQTMCEQLQEVAQAEDDAA